MHEKIIIIFLSLLLITSFLYLAFIESYGMGLEKSNYWTLSFVEPKGEILDFEIHNLSDLDAFGWTASDGIKTQQGEIRIKKGFENTVKISKNDFGGNRIEILVSVNNNKKMIYKIFEKNE